MNRVVSVYSDEELAQITKVAEDYGFTVSGLQKYATLLLCNKDNRTSNVDIVSLIKEAKAVALNVKPDHSFVVSSLLPQSVWTKLTKKDKHTIAVSIGKFVLKNPDKFTVKKVKGESNRYIRKE